MPQFLLQALTESVLESATLDFDGPLLAES